MWDLTNLRLSQLSDKHIYHIWVFRDHPEDWGNYHIEIFEEGIQAYIDNKDQIMENPYAKTREEWHLWNNRYIYQGDKNIDFSKA